MTSKGFTGRDDDLIDVPSAQLSAAPRQKTKTLFKNCDCPAQYLNRTLPKQKSEMLCRLSQLAR